MNSVDSWRWTERPTDDSGFDAMMTSLDQHLATCNLQPFQRGLNAALLVSTRLGLSGHSLLPTSEQRGNPFSPTDLLGRVHDWYRDNYGKRMNLDMSPGSVVFRMRGTLWRLRVPKVWGRVDMFLSGDLTNTGRNIGTAQEPASHNLLLSIDEMTQAHASRLTYQELGLIASAYARGNAGLVWFDALEGHELFGHARNDYRHSVDALMDGNALSKAKWDTAQCAEKTFKGLLGSAGHDYPTSAGHGHDIRLLGGLVTTHLGISLPEADLAIVHCPTKVRYGDIPVLPDEALASHSALLRLLTALAKLVRTS